MRLMSVSHMRNSYLVFSHVRKLSLTYSRDPFTVRGFSVETLWDLRARWAVFQPAALHGT